MKIKLPAATNHKGGHRNPETRFPFPLKLTATFVFMLMLSGFCSKKETSTELTRLAGVKTDKGLAGHYYTEIYDPFFLPLKRSATKILEIGIGRGDSLKMWRDYFPQAIIYGIDIVPSPELDFGRIRTFVADQGDRTQLRSIIAAFGGYFDIIIDDGGHSMSQQQISLGFLFKYLRPGGYYVIEDVHTSLRQFWMGFGVKDHGINSTLNMFFHFISGNLIESQYLSSSEEKYLSRTIEFCNLFMRNRPSPKSPSIMCILKKKDRLK